MNAKSGIAAIRGLGYVILLCDDFEKMERFYRDTFRFEIEDEEPGVWVGFRVGALFLALRKRGRKYDGPSVPHASASIQLSFQVPPADVDIAYKALLDRGVEVIEGPTNQDWPHRTLFFHDPENNVIEIFSDIHQRDMAEAPSGIHALIGSFQGAAPTE
ncbi:MAG: VOC family protein [Pseudomonadota bacterium]